MQICACQANNSTTKLCQAPGEGVFAGGESTHISHNLVSTPHWGGDGDLEGWKEGQLNRESTLCDNTFKAFNDTESLPVSILKQCT